MTALITPVNDAPVNNVPSPQAGTPDTPYVFTGAQTVTITDIDAGDSPMLVALRADHGTITLASTAGLSFTSGDGSDDALVGFSGSLTSINTALAGMSVTPESGYNGLITMTLISNDQGATGAGGAKSDTDTFVLGINATDLPPDNNAPATAETNEDTPLTFGGAGQLRITDSDSTNMTADLTVDSGMLTLGVTTNLTFTNGDGTGDTHVTFSGALTDVNSALSTLTFTPAANFFGTVTMTFVSDDGQLQNSVTTTITVDSVNDAPTIGAPATVTTQENVAFSFTGASTVSVADVDVGSAELTYTVSATHGGASLTGGAATLSDLNSALAALTFTPDSDYVGDATITIDVNDNGNSGAGGPLTAEVTSSP